MGAQLTEMVIETVLRDGLGDLRANPGKLDDLFSKFTEAQFLNQYGQTQINRLKTYIANNQIRLVHAWSMVPTSVPCFSIQLIRSDEVENLQQLGDEELDEEETITPAPVIENVTPGTYDTLTGKMTVISVTDLSTVRPGMIFKDADDAEFTIVSASNLSGNKYLNIGRGQTPTLTGDGQITRPISITRMERGMIRLRETITIGCHAKDDIHITKYLYYILMYILKSRQDVMTNRGVELSRGTGGIQDRDDAFKGGHIFSRFMDVNCMSEFTWDKDFASLIDSFDLTVKTNTPNTDSPVAADYNTSPDEE